MVDSIALQLQNVSKSYGKNAALKPIDLTIHSGQMIALFGHNGAGKSTLLRIIATALRPDTGQVHIRGADSNKHQSWCKSQIGYVGHQNYLYPDLSPIENLQFFAKLYGIGSDKKQIFHILDALELTGFSTQPVRNLSNGQQKRTAIARALVHRPSILLMDEPDAGLDTHAQYLIKSILQEISNSGGTVFFSSHNPSDSLIYANEFVLLSKGNLVVHHENDETSKAELVEALMVQS